MFVRTLFFLEIQLSLRQFLFEVNRVSVRGEIFEKLCISHHVFSITQRQKFTGYFLIFTFIKRQKKFFKNLKKIEAHRNVQVHFFCAVARKSAGVFFLFSSTFTKMWNYLYTFSYIYSTEQTVLYVYKIVYRYARRQSSIPRAL